MRLSLVLLICLFLFATPAKAARSLDFTSDKSQLTGEEEMQITASVSGFASDESISIKGAFYQEGSTNYFGLTKSGDNWIKNSASTGDQFKIKISDWDNKILVKGDFADSGFKGGGDYKFKVGFYYTTSGGNLSSINWSTNILTVSLTAPSPTPTVTLPPTMAPTKIPTPSSTKSPTPSLAPSKSVTPSPRIVTEAANEQSVTPSDTVGINVLGIESTPSSVQPDGIKSNKSVTALILVGLGIVFISTSIYMAIQTSKAARDLK